MPMKTSTKFCLECGEETNRMFKYKKKQSVPLCDGMCFALHYGLPATNGNMIVKIEDDWEVKK